MEAGAGAPPAESTETQAPPAPETGQGGGGDERSQAEQALIQRVDQLEQRVAEPPAQEPAPSMADQLAEAMREEEATPPGQEDVSAVGGLPPQGTDGVYYAQDAQGNIVPVDAEGYPLNQSQVPDETLARLERLEQNYQSDRAERVDAQLGALAEAIPQLQDGNFLNQVGQRLLDAGVDPNAEPNPHLIEMAARAIIAEGELGDGPAGEAEQRASIETNAGPSQPEQEKSYSETRASELKAALGDSRR